MKLLKNPLNITKKEQEIMDMHEQTAPTRTLISADRKAKIVIKGSNVISQTKIK